MAITQRRTRKQIRQSIGIGLGALDIDAGSAERSPSFTSNGPGVIDDQSLAFGGEDELRGKWIYATSSVGTEQARRIIGSNADFRSLTVSVPFSSTPSTAWTYEIWDETVSPVAINDYINQAIIESTRKGAVPFVSDSLHTGIGLRELPLDSRFAGVTDIYWRTSVPMLEVSNADTAWSPGAAGSGTAVTGSYREGKAANRFSFASTGFVAYDATSSALDLSDFTHLELWFRGSNYLATSTGTYSIDLCSDSAGVTPVWSADIPVANLDTAGSGLDEWRWHSLPLDIPGVGSPYAMGSSADVGIINSVGLQVDISVAGSVPIWIDGVRAVKGNSEVYAKIPRKFWGVNKTERKIRISDDFNPGYSKLEVHGVKRPSLLSTDSALSEIDSQYIVSSATAKAEVEGAPRTTPRPTARPTTPTSSSPTSGGRGTPKPGALSRRSTPSGTRRWHRASVCVSLRRPTCGGWGMPNADNSRFCKLYRGVYGYPAIANGLFGEGV